MAANLLWFELINGFQTDPITTAALPAPLKKTRELGLNKLWTVKYRTWTAKIVLVLTALAFLLPAAAQADTIDKRLDSALNISEYIRGEGKDVTNPMLDLDDFLNLEFGQDYDGNQLQLPDQQFANLYWFRYDWFTDPELKKAFKEEYGYELGVPVNWAAYEDIAEFFTGREIDGQTVYGHMDYGKKSPSLGWRFTAAWLSIAGAGDKGLPNEMPVDEWGIRVEDRIPVGASVERGGAANGPAAVVCHNQVC
jgi:hypothetical protein